MLAYAVESLASHCQPRKSLAFEPPQPDPAQRSRRNPAPTSTDWLRLLPSSVGLARLTTQS